MKFAEFIAPVDQERFLRDHYGLLPLHIQAGGAEVARRGLLSWEQLNALLSIRRHWTESNVNLIMNSRPVAAEHYVDAVRTGDGVVRLADPAKIEVFLAMGASLVTNGLHDVSPRIREVAAMLARQLGGVAGANAYCSFQEVQAFASHCDLHEVFAVQVEGEKTWRIYENRAEAPVEPITGDGAQQLIDRVKGKVLMTVHMRPGDLLYIPRGYFHDALASSASSLHLTFSLKPMNGLALFDMLRQAALDDEDFRAYLPDGRAGEGEELRARLQELGGKIAEMVTTPLFQADVAARQRAQALSDHGTALPQRPAIAFYARTSVQAEVLRMRDGVFLRHGGGKSALGVFGEPVGWALQQKALSAPQLSARYPWLEQAEAERLLELLVSSGAFTRYRGQVGPATGA